MMTARLLMRASVRLIAVGALVTGAIVVSSSSADAATRARFKGGVLTVKGDARSNTIVISRTKAGLIKVDNGRVRVAGRKATVRNTRLIVVQGSGGNDVIRLNERRGKLPRASLSGGTGNDTLIGGSRDDTLSGDAGNDRLLGQAGNDQMLWRPGDGSDVDEGGTGTDTVTVSTDATSEQLTVAPNGTRVRLSRVTPAPFTLDIGTSERLALSTNGGNDTVTATGSLAGRILLDVDGGPGNDVVTGSNGADTLRGGPGNDTLTGREGNDTLIGGAGDDQVFGQSGNDRMVWNPGDGTDVDEGGSDTDTVAVTGDATGEQFTITANGTRVRLDRLSPAPFSLDIGTTESLTLSTAGGNDAVSATGNLAALIQVRVDGGPGDDTLLGSNGADVLLGGDGNDHVDGQQGNDLALLGAGNDTFQWDPGDGSDTVEGQAGTDTLLFNGANINEMLEVSANGGRVRFTRNVANIVMDLDDVETLHVNAIGGTDQLQVDDVGGTDLRTVEANLASPAGGTTGDGQADTVQVVGTAGDDVITAAGDSALTSLTGLAAVVRVSGIDGGTDVLSVLGLAGDDIVNGSGLGVSATSLRADGGDGNDLLTGGDGADTLLGGAGDDTLRGGPGLDVLDGGTGNNTIIQD